LYAINGKWWIGGAKIGISNSNPRIPKASDLRVAFLAITTYYLHFDAGDVVQPGCDGKLYEISVIGVRHRIFD
jgi:hypothetical protein